MPEHKKGVLGDTTQVNQMFKQVVYLPVHYLIPQEKFELVVRRVVKISERYREYLRETKDQTLLKEWPQNLVLAKL